MGVVRLTGTPGVAPGAAAGGAATEFRAAGPRLVAKGLAAAPGRAIGPARVVRDVGELGTFRPGEILVSGHTTQEWLPALRVAAAVVSAEGGRTTHSAIVSRELGIPCVVGAEGILERVATGETITVDGTFGLVFSGAAGEPKSARPPGPAELRELPQWPATGTRIFMNLGSLGKLDAYAHLPFDGIGLMRFEFLIADLVGAHPRHLLAQGRGELFVDRIVEGLARAGSTLWPRPIILRFSDLKTNEYRLLEGGEAYEPLEQNPMLGWRGVARYVHPDYEEAFRLECRAVRRAREELGLTNLWVMLPFARTVEEVLEVYRVMEAEGLRRGRDFKVWIMAELPVNVLLADRFAQLCDGFSIGSNDLVQTVLAVDRDSARLSRMGYFDDRDPAVLEAMRHLIATAHRYGRPVSICGQGPSVYPDLCEFLVGCGIDCISVNPDAVVETRRLVAGLEQKLLLTRLARLEARLRGARRRSAAATAGRLSGGGR
ncbi:MAG TPA: putative PEP-binding protein [Thermodesulfobacteriota bacterium]|nr:putative PEP-binding protein [Thermodesulfobacteriota bacterium]